MLILFRRLTHPHSELPLGKSGTAPSVIISDSHRQYPCFIIHFLKHQAISCQTENICADTHNNHKIKCKFYIVHFVKFGTIHINDIKAIKYPRQYHADFIGCVLRSTNINIPSVTSITARSFIFLIFSFVNHRRRYYDYKRIYKMERRRKVRLRYSHMRHKVKSLKMNRQPHQVKLYL